MQKIAQILETWGIPYTVQQNIFTVPVGTTHELSISSDGYYFMRHILTGMRVFETELGDFDKGMLQIQELITKTVNENYENMTRKVLSQNKDNISTQIQDVRKSSENAREWFKQNQADLLDPLGNMKDVQAMLDVLRTHFRYVSENKYRQVIKELLPADHPAISLLSKEDILVTDKLKKWTVLRISENIRKTWNMKDTPYVLMDHHPDGCQLVHWNEYEWDEILGPKEIKHYLPATDQDVLHVIQRIPIPSVDIDKYGA